MREGRCLLQTKPRCYAAQRDRGGLQIVGAACNHREPGGWTLERPCATLLLPDRCSTSDARSATMLLNDANRPRPSGSTGERRRKPAVPTANHIRLGGCAENLIRVDDVTESPKLAK